MTYSCFTPGASYARDIDLAVSQDTATFPSLGTIRLGAGVVAYIQEILALTRRWFIHIQRERLSLFFSVAQPALWLIFFGGMFQKAINRSVVDAPDYTTFMLPGIMVFTVVGDALNGAMPLLWDKENGFLAKLLTAPISRSSLIVSRFLFQTILGSVQGLVILGIGLALGVRIETGIPGVVVMLAVTGLVGMALTASFLALAYVVKNHGDFFAVTGFITLPLFFTSSAFAPVSAMPGWMQVVAHLNPLTYAIDSMRTLVVHGWRASVATDFAILCLFVAVCLVVATAAFQRHRV
jgi:ABC-2 type transport system permease protein